MVYFNNNTNIFIALFDNNKNNKYNRLSFEYRKKNIDKPYLMIFNVKTWEPVWKLSGIRYLNNLREIELYHINFVNDIYNIYIKITIKNFFY